MFVSTNTKTTPASSRRRHNARTGAKKVLPRLPSVLVLSHSHPKLTRGGAEIAAYTMFGELKKKGAKTWFLGCAGAASESRLGASLTQPYGADDYVYHPNAPFDYFKFANPDVKFPKTIEELVAELQPDIVHAHHYVRFGVEMFSAIRRGWPKAKIVLTLHEYLAICHHHGQMMKARSLQRCEKESYADCSACFPELGKRDFFLRKRYLQMFLEDVDLFISPSSFLVDRYVAWGLPATKLVVLENMLPRPVTTMLKADTDNSKIFTKQTLKTNAGNTPLKRTIRFGFFGQMSPFKGVTVLIDAARQLEKLKIDNVTIEIFGDYSAQAPEFQKIVIEALDKAGSNVIYHGSYDNADVNRLMRKVDAMIIPSIWWENSPVVIQEAFMNGLPVICSNIGGMAEKVTHGVNGLHFEVNSPMSLATTLAALAEDPSRLDILKKGVRPPQETNVLLEKILQLYSLI